MKFRFTADFVTEARDLETALRDVANHVTTAATHVGNGHQDLSQMGRHFTIAPVSHEDPHVDIHHDPIVKEHGPYKLTEEAPEAAAATEENA